MGAAVLGITLLALLWTLERPAPASAHPAAQATATATITATNSITGSATVSPTGTTFTNACGVVISTEVVTPTTQSVTTTVEVSSTIETQAPVETATPTPTTPAGGVGAPTAQVLRIGEDIYPAVLDPQRAAFVNEFEILNLAYEGLVSVDPQGKIEPAAAESYEFSADGKQLTFKLRPGIKRLDGTPITSKSFAAAIKRGLDPCLGGREYSSVLNVLVGAQDASDLDVDTHTQADRQAALDAVGIKTPDDNTLVFEFAEPVGDFWLYTTSLPIFFPTDVDLAAKNESGWDQVAGNHNGNGAYIIYEFDEGERIVLVANPDYWRGKPAIDRIEFTYNTDSQAVLDAYKRGELDIDANVTAELVPQILSDTIASDFVQTDAGQTAALAFNDSIKPFDDRIVRTAFSQAVDREGFVQSVLLGNGTPTTRWIPSGVPGNQADKPGVPASDPGAAVKTLVDNGYGTADGKVDCAKLGEMKFTYPDSPTNKQQVDYLVANFKKVFGCDIIPTPVNAIEFTRLVRNVKTNPQLSLQRWVGDYPHPENWLSAYWTCGSFAREFGYCNLYLDDLLKKADQEINLEKALTLYQQAEDLMIQDVPGAFLYNPYNLGLVKPYVMGPLENLSPRDAGWVGETGPVWSYQIDLSKVPDSYPRE